MTLSPHEIEAIALRVVELLEDRRLAHGTSELVDASTLAHRLGVSRSFIYSNADHLGGRRLGDGPKARLRFNVDQALAAYEAMTPTFTGSENSTPTRPRRRPKASSTAALLPIRGRAA